MTSKLKYHKNYTEFGEPYQLVLPLSLEGLVPNDDSVRLLSHELEELDYSLLYQAYSAKGRNPAVDPKTMFKILAYAYSQNIYSSRKIETACRRDINFMWLLAGQKAPDHSTIARFRTGFLAEACENLFYQMVKRLEQADELSKETVFIDGTKLEASANKYTFVWKKSVGKWEEKMFRKIQEAVQLLNHEYIQDFSVGAQTRTQDLQKISRFLEENAGQTKPSLFMDEAKGRTGTRGIWKCSADFLNAGEFMTGMQPVFRAGIITARQIRMPPLCI